MNPAGLVLPTVLVGVGAHLALRGATTRVNRRRVQRRRLLERMAGVHERAGRQTMAPAGAAPGEPNADMRRYFVPVGLRLGEARAIVAAARLADAEIYAEQVRR